MTITIHATIVGNKIIGKDQLVSYGASIEMKEGYQLSGTMTDKIGIQISRINHLHS